jgi:hypothetical protein
VLKFNFEYITIMIYILWEELGMIALNNSIIEYLAYAHAITANFGHNGESVSKIIDYVNPIV